MPLIIRKQLLAINNCLLNYGKYIDAFKQNFMTSYSLIRVSLRENVESIEIISKEEIEEDEKRKKEEIKVLGLLSFFILNENSITPTNPPSKNEKKGGDSFPNYLNELNSIEDKVKAECAKVYIGEYAKLINNPAKIPPSIAPFIQNFKTEMDNFRIKCIRDLRTYVINSYFNFI